MSATLAAPRAEMLLEPIHAWRAWSARASAGGSGFVLMPIGGAGKPWPPRRPAHGTCIRRAGHAAPVFDCTCGLHAVHDPAELRRARDAAVVGTVALWGRVVEHERGYRAAFAYPQRLRLVCHLCLCLPGASPSTSCDVVVRHRGGRLVPLCEPHLELSRRFGYPVPRLLEARAVRSNLLDAYAVDPLPSLDTPLGFS